MVFFSHRSSVLVLPWLVRVCSTGARGCSGATTASSLSVSPSMAQDAVCTATSFLVLTFTLCRGLAKLSGLLIHAATCQHEEAKHSCEALAMFTELWENHDVYSHFEDLRPMCSLSTVSLDHSTFLSVFLFRSLMVKLLPSCRAQKTHGRDLGMIINNKLSMCWFVCKESPVSELPNRKKKTFRLAHYIMVFHKIWSQHEKSTTLLLLFITPHDRWLFSCNSTPCSVFSIPQCMRLELSSVTIITQSEHVITLICQVQRAKLNLEREREIWWIMAMWYQVYNKDTIFLMINSAACLHKNLKYRLHNLSVQC